MRRQLSRLSPHQNGKVFGILTAVASLVFVIPMFLVVLFAAPPVDQHGNPASFPIFLVLIFPAFYLVFGYLATVIGCAIYNVLYRLIGGFEFEVEDHGI